MFRQALRKAFIVWKFRFDLGFNFMSLLNLTLLSISASGPLGRFLHISKLTVLVPLVVLFGFVGVLAFGFFLDVVVHYFQHYNTEQRTRDIQWIEVMQRLEKIDSMLRK